MSDLGATMRNEAILLLGMFNYEAKDYLEDGSRSWADFIAEAGRVWAKVRPEGGLAEVDRQRQRARYGFALEAWARWFLRVQPLPLAYITPATRETYTQMTGREIEFSRPVDRPEPAAGPMAATMANVVPLRPSP